MAAPCVAASRTLVVSSVFTAQETTRQLGQEAYSYTFVRRGFGPLLERWARVVEVTQPESRLDYALWQARQAGSQPVHLSFRPLHLTYLSAHAPNVAFPFWEFPDLPDANSGNNPRNNWVRIADRLALILTASTFTRDAFVRAGVQTPVAVVPVPIGPEYFAVGAWEPGGRAVLDCPCYVFPQPDALRTLSENPWVPAVRGGLSLRARLKRIYNAYVKPRFPRRLHHYLALAARAAAYMGMEHERETRIPFPVQPRLELSGVVYTSILNPFDPRKNWQDLLSAYLLALGGQEDATLVVKLVVSPRLTPKGLNGMLDYYHELGLKHRCRLVFVPAYLSDVQMIELARASTFYVNTARAEGACLPLQDYLAAGRPGIAPRHTALTDYFSAEVGWVVNSSREPAPWPHDLAHGHTTSWHRLHWQSLHDQFRASYEMARHQPERYHDVAARGRECMRSFASAERVWPRLEAALGMIGEPGTAVGRRAVA